MEIISEQDLRSISGGLEPVGVAVVTLFGLAALESLPQLAIGAVVGFVTGPYVFSEPVFQNVTFTEATYNAFNNIKNAPINCLAGGALGLGVSTLSQFG